MADFSVERLNKETPIPLYYQLKSLILDKINSGELQPGDMLPTEAEFAEMFSLSRTTIRQAIGELVMENRLYRIKSKGTFVSKPKIPQRFMQSVENFNESMRQIGMTPRTEVLSCKYIVPCSEIAAILKLPAGRTAIELVRRRFANDEPLLLVENYLIPECEIAFHTDLNRYGLYEKLSENGATRIAHLRRQIEVVAASDTEAKQLDIRPGTHILRATSISVNAAGRPVDYGIVYYRGDKTTFTVEVDISYD